MEEQREKIEVLKLCRKLLSHACLYDDKNSSKIGTNTIRKGILRFLIAFSLIINIFFLYKHCYERKFDPKLTCGAACILVVLSQGLMNYFNSIIENDIIPKCINHLQITVDKRCKHSAKSFEIYREQEAKNTKLILLLLKFTITIMITFSGVPILFPISYAIFGFPKPSFWPLPFSANLGFDITTYLGFYITVIIQTVTSCVYFLITISLTVFQVNLCSYADACLQDFMRCCDDMDVRATTQSEIQKKNLQNKKLIIAIELHNDLIKVLKHIQTVMSVPITTQMLDFVATIALSLLMLENGITEISYDFVAGLDCLATQGLLFFISCYFGTRMTDCSAKVSEKIYNAVWYHFPLNQQKYIILMMARAQKPFYLYGSGLFIGSLETYLKLMQTAVSYYIMFRELGGEN